jgi:hypothetical protein
MANRLPIVYLGPSLPLHRAQRFLKADYRPPVRRGDLPEWYDGTVIIIDGEFRQSLSVSPNEILRLLDRGTLVVGAASMGALRAVELGPFGMLGVGWVYDAYLCGRIEADDEVAVTYNPDGFECLTVPRWLELLQASRQIDSLTGRRLLACARAQFYADRTEGALLSSWERAVGPEELCRLLHAGNGSNTNVKAHDAELVLELVKRAGGNEKGERQWNIVLDKDG